MKQIDNLSDIESTLTSLYEEHGDPCRASLFNFVIWAPSEARSAYLKLLIDKVAERFPCRILFITQSEQLKGPREISVSVNFNGTSACDRIEIKTSVAETPLIPYFILPHLLPDLPIYLLWGQDPTLKGALYDTLFPYAKRVIFDSICVESLPDFARSFVKHPDKKLRDVNWSLITGWRALFCRIFDTPAKINELKEGIHIVISHKGDTSIQSHYFKAWLLAKFKLNPESLIIEKSEGDGLDGDLVEVAVTTDHEHHYSITRKQTKALIHISDRETCELPILIPLTHIQRGFHFWRELLFEEGAPDYLSTLKAINHEA